MRVLVTGASGRIGALVAAGLGPDRTVPSPAEARIQVRTATRRPATPDDVEFSYTDPGTWEQAFSGVDAMFVMRPPDLSKIERDMLPALRAARSAGVRRMVLLSIQGADKNRAAPHRKIEAWMRDADVDWTFVRAGFFMQNLSTTHAAEIRDLGRILVPAGAGRTSFVDARDVAEVAVRALLDEGLAGRAVTPTGASALTYTEVAEIIGAELGTTVDYGRCGPVTFWRHNRRLGRSRGETGVMLGIYSACRFGLAAGTTTDVEEILGRPPIAFEQFAHDERAAWQPDWDRARTG